MHNPTFSTPSEREEVLNWAFKQEWWERFQEHANEMWLKGYSKHDDWLFIRWFLSALEYHYISMILDYGREQLGWTLKSTEI